MTSWLRLLQAVAAASSTASTTSRRVAFLPEKHVDIIFSVSPEPSSFFWVCVILVLFVIAVTLFYLRRRRRQARDTIS
jgi:cell division protein FtsW (lipid II flippase)